jgi:hypothetical protein
LQLGQAEQSSVAVAPRDYIQPIDDSEVPDRLGPAVTFATTEHFNLQAARAATVSEASMEDIAYAQRIGRLRGFYLALAPELKPYQRPTTSVPVTPMRRRPSTGPRSSSPQCKRPRRPEGGN